MTKAWKQSLTGRAITVSRPAAGEIDVMIDLPETLARISRFDGAVPGGVYTVAQHCAVMADVILEETGDAHLAAIALLHDAHEFIIGDITTPAVEGLAEVEIELFGDSRIISVIAEAKRRADAAIFRACGTPLPTAEQVRIVKAYDTRMLATERRHLLANCPRRWNAAIEKAEPLRLRGALRIWPTARAADEYRARLKTLCPAAGRIA
ncbi:hypothetical protein [Oricola thermophila]|uniref:HD domain-containing protein n=1 Tax=Oricola thermophila TaxID=2742145 RepID=A0A6N1VHJ2_9HYPH|nr:hypothetical protein [Oricola thermophila]QKV20268.1 hypothetical protein HTY61_18315 [Oricola thermophila]